MSAVEAEAVIFSALCLSLFRISARYRQAWRLLGDAPGAP